MFHLPRMLLQQNQNYLQNKVCHKNPTFPAQKFLGAKATMAIKMKLPANVFPNQRAADESKWSHFNTGINLDKQTSKLRLA